MAGWPSISQVAAGMEDGSSPFSSTKATKWGLRSQILPLLIREYGPLKLCPAHREERAPRPREPPGGAVFLGSTGALSSSLRGRIDVSHSRQRMAERTKGVTPSHIPASPVEGLTHWHRIPINSEATSSPGLGGLELSIAHLPSPLSVASGSTCEK